MHEPLQRVSAFLSPLAESRAFRLAAIMVPIWVGLVVIVLVTNAKVSGPDTQSPIPNEPVIAAQEEPTPVPEVRQTATPSDIEFLIDIDVIHRFRWPVAGHILIYFDPGRYSGIDIQYEGESTPVKAAAAGTVVSAGNDCCGAGQAVVVRHEGGFTTLYSRLVDLNVSVGQELPQGEILGWAGSSDDPDKQVHFELRDSNNLVDPLRYLSSEQEPLGQVVACPSRTVLVDPASQMYLRFTSTSLTESQVTAASLRPSDPPGVAPVATAKVDESNAVVITFGAPSAATTRSYEYGLRVSLSKAGVPANDIECRLVLRTVPSQPNLNPAIESPPSPTPVATSTPTRTPVPTITSTPTRTPVRSTPRPTNIPGLVTSIPTVGKTTTPSSSSTPPAGPSNRTPTRTPTRAR